MGNGSSVRVGVDPWPGIQQSHLLNPTHNFQTQMGLGIGTNNFAELLVLWRETPMAWGTTTDRFDSRNQSFLICNRNKMSSTKGSDLVPYLGRLK